MVHRPTHLPFLGLCWRTWMMISMERTYLNGARSKSVNPPGQIDEIMGRGGRGGQHGLLGDGAARRARDDGLARHAVELDTPTVHEERDPARKLLRGLTTG